MKKIIVCLFLLGILNINAQTGENKKYTILLTGASFASSNNGWFELGCKHLDANPINKAVSGEAIANAANQMIKGEMYTKEELENIDAFVIMHVHDKNVAAVTGLKENYQDYPTPFDRSNYAAAYDYVIKRYITECYNLKFDKDSKYYNTPSGKPAIIVFCTHWHDARTVYNPAIRTLAARWGFPLVEFDRNIGFSKDHLHPVTGKQYSLVYSHDKETITGEEFGWHPLNGQDQYIQQRMAAIFAGLMKTVLPLKP
jgi:hypothetical protein